MLLIYRYYEFVIQNLNFSFVDLYIEESATAKLLNGTEKEIKLSMLKEKLMFVPFDRKIDHVDG